MNDTPCFEKARACLPYVLLTFTVAAFTLHAPSRLATAAKRAQPRPLSPISVNYPVPLRPLWARTPAIHWARVAAL